MEDYKKKYEEALERAKEIHAEKRAQPFDVMTKIFPELKESEDERIWTINYLNNRKLNSSIIEEKESLKKAIAWLEKQGEQNPAWSEEDEPQKELAETYLAVFDKKFPILPTLEGKKLADYKNFLNKCQQILGLKYWSIRPLQAKLFEKLSLLWAAWGAEHLKGLGQTNEDTDNKNHAWSEEDEEEANYIADFIENLIKKEKLVSKKTMIMEEMVDWLRALRPPYYCDNCKLKKSIQGWKPSDEQMESLWNAIPNIPNSEKDIDTITELSVLYEDLKKLREE